MLKRLSISLFLIAIILIGCARTNPTPIPEFATQTALAATVRANVMRPTATFTIVPSPTVTLASVQQRPISPDDFATFIMDVTIPDYTPIDPEAIFTKTWRLKNNTPVTWSAGYSIIFESGDQMGAPLSLPLPKSVAPNEFIDLSIEFTAPTTPGEYRSNWMLENNKGQKFGVGEKGDSPFYLIIIVVDPNNINTTGGLAGGANIIDATISIDQTNYTGLCPVNLNLAGSVTSNSSGPVLWSLNLNTTTSGFSFDSSGSHNLTFGENGGIQYWEYILTVSNTVSANAQLSVIGSNAALSSVQSFTVICE